MFIDSRLFAGAISAAGVVHVLRWVRWERNREWWEGNDLEGDSRDRCLLGEIEENHGDLSHSIRQSGCDLNRVPPECV
jgi:hypothetical protein